VDVVPIASTISWTSQPPKHPLVGESFVGMEVVIASLYGEDVVASISDNQLLVEYIQ